MVRKGHLPEVLSAEERVRRPEPVCQFSARRTGVEPDEAASLFYSQRTQAGPFGGETLGVGALEERAIKAEGPAMVFTLKLMPWSGCEADGVAAVGADVVKGAEVALGRPDHKHREWTQLCDENLARSDLHCAGHRHPDSPPKFVVFMLKPIVAGVSFAEVQR